MRHGNLLAASITAATFVVLALLPLTKDALRFDMQMAAGKQVMGRTLIDLGVRPDSMPLGGIGPKIASPPGHTAVKSSEFSVQLANALLLGGRQKWAALQTLVTAFPDNPAGHAALVRMACKNGGTVDVGHAEEQETLSPNPRTIQKSAYQPDPNDPVIMLRSCEAGEQVDPENAYFPAMAAIAHLARKEDDAAHAALRRAAQKPHWREYIEVEAQGRMRRSELLNGPQNSLTNCANLASILFPHYAGLRSMARVVTAQAVRLEQTGDIKGGIALRRTVAQVGGKMREQCSSIIGGLVGMAMIRITTLRPNGAPALESGPHEGDSVRQKVDAQFLTYLATHGEPEDVLLWQKHIKSEGEAKAIIKQGIIFSVFGTRTLFESQWKLLVNMALLSAATLLSVLGGIALLRYQIGSRMGRTASAFAVLGFFAILGWVIWHALGNFRDIIAFGNIIQGLAGEVDSAAGRAEMEALRRTLVMEGSIGLFALLAPPLYLCVIAVMAWLHRLPMGQLLQRWTLPLAALLTIGYAVHLTDYANRERVVHTELQQVVTHEGRYMAEKLGETWPANR